MTKEDFLKHISLIQSNIGLDDELCIFNLNKLKDKFPCNENGFSEIEHYSFFTNFGKPSLDSEYETPDMFWERLTNI